jgi:FMN phosphatase YigB (HAD superfamily)
LLRRIHELINGALTEEEIAAELVRADGQRSHFRDTSTELIELTHEQLWSDYVADLWPEKARAAVIAHAAELTLLWTRRPDWRLRPGIADLLDYTIGIGLPVAVVSNTACGRAHREMLDRSGLTGAFAIQVYSDELGVFKPHPEMIWTAARELDVATSHCWFVGDKIDKDIVCARRAGVGSAILMPEGEVRPGPATPDEVVADGYELLALLRRSIVDKASVEPEWVTLSRRLANDPDVAPAAAPQPPEGPAQPEPAQPHPAQPHPAQPHPAQPELAQPEVPFAGAFEPDTADISRL